MTRYLSKEALDDIAKRVLQAYQKLPEVQERGYLFVDTTLLVKGLLHLNIEYRHLSPDRMTLGLTCFDETAVEVFDSEEDLFFFDGKTVLIEKDLIDESACVGRHNFTLAHEGCHHILRMLFPSDYVSDIQARRVLRFRQDRQAVNSLEEWKVNALTSSILMPEGLIQNGMKLAGLSNRIDILNAVYRPKEYKGFCKVCALLGVSKQALAIRMQQLGLLGKVYLKNPHDLINIYMEDDEVGI